MTALFFYGTLRHLPLLAIVLGRDLDRQNIHPARLGDYRAISVRGQPFPLLISDPGAAVGGVVIGGLTDRDIDRLNYYEGGFDFELRTIEALGETGVIKCQTYIPNGAEGLSGETWELSRWSEKWAALSEIAATEAMGYFGRITAASLAQKFPMIRTRAAARLAAKSSVAVKIRSGLDPAAIDVLEENTDHLGYFINKTIELRHPMFSGGQSPVLRREVFVATDAAIVLPYDPLRDVVLLVEQFRMGPFGRGDLHPWSLEPVAGRVDAGETPEETAYRETVEEAGITLKGLEKIAAYYPTPGYSTEYFYCFLGLCDLPADARRIGGLESEDEDIQTHILPFEQAMELLITGEADNGPLVLSLIWLQRERARLRGQGASQS